MGLMCIGPHVFRPVGLNGKAMEFTTEAVVAEFPRWGLQDGAQWQGMRRSTFVISGVLFPDAVGGLPDYQAIRVSQLMGLALPMLTMGSGFVASVLGSYVVERVTDLSEYDGQMIGFDVELRTT
ncbi:phage tail protein [Ancylobacter sp. G4_0304]|uniref:phage tail protein n=1 Tax=Ancylobacter sp. G4_0304 TaxID=3114289 RepID=UPI0039C67F87